MQDRAVPDDDPSKAIVQEVSMCMAATRIAPGDVGGIVPTG
jgi:hypothetical protein